MPNKQGFKVPIEVRWFIIQRKRENTPPTNIISQVKDKFNRRITFDTVRRLWAKYLRTGDVKDLKSPGRPKVLNSREERSIARMFQNQSGLSVKWAAVNILINSKPIKRTTMRRTLRRQGLIPKTSERGKEIVRKNKIKRVVFAKDHRSWGENDWARVIFSDESQLFPKRTVSAVSWVRKGEPANQPEEENLRNKNIRVWGYIAYNGDRRIHRFQETMTSIKYKRLLELDVLNLMAQRGPRNRPLIFMQDGASCHMSNDVKNWFTQNGIQTLRWPAQSPDINPMENIWAALKNELWKRRQSIRNANDVWYFTQEIFYNLTLGYIHKLYNSLPERIESIIRRGGNRINY